MLLTLSAAVFSVFFAAGCKPAEPPPPSGPPAREYQVKGLVGSVSADGKEIHIHHEAIPEFVGIDGQAEPMESMSMPFPVADPALAQGIAAGDRIDFTFRVDWEGKRPLEVTRVAKLPADARLSFEKGLP